MKWLEYLGQCNKLGVLFKAMRMRRQRVAWPWTYHQDGWEQFLKSNLFQQLIKIKLILFDHGQVGQFRPGLFFLIDQDRFIILN